MEPDIKALFADAQADQATAALSRNAKGLASYYRTLIEGKVPEALASTLTLEMLRYLLRLGGANQQKPQQ